MKLLLVLLIISISFIYTSKYHSHSYMKSYSLSNIDKSAKPAAKKHVVAGRKKNSAKKSKKAKKSKPKHKIKVIPFGPAAKTVNHNINSLGERANKNVASITFPFKVRRCDQIILFPAEYINDEDDYRVRRPGFVAITAHYTSLFAGEDGQKLISQVLTSLSRAKPNLIKGARGCIKVHGGVRQKSLNICTSSKKDANNILKVYNAFERCRLGDNLVPISPALLKKLMKLCGITRAALKGKGSKAAIEKLRKAVSSSTNHSDGEDHHSKGISNKATEAAKKKLLKRFMKGKKKKPKFFVPSKFNNPWEKERRSYVRYSNVKVPGTRRR